MPLTEFGTNGDQFLNCPICFSTYKDPRVLDCLHSFCLRCIDNISHARYGHVRCPICNKATILAKKDPSYLPVNFYVNNIIDFLAVQLNSADDIECSNCVGTSGCTSRCMTCGDYLCQKCSEAHQRTKFTKGHTLIPLTELQDSEAEYVSDKFHRSLTCREHSNEPLKYFCCECEITVCRDCLVKDHIKHGCVTFDQVWQKYRSEIAILVNKTKQRIHPLDASVNNIKQTLENVQFNANTARKSVHLHIKSCIGKLNEYGDKLVEKINTMEREKMRTLGVQLQDVQQTLETLVSGCQFTENVLKYGNEAEILMIVKQMKLRLNELQEFSIDNEVKEQGVVDYKFTEKKFEDCLKPEILGEIVTSYVYPNLCVLDSNQLKGVKVARPCFLTLRTVTKTGRMHHLGGEKVQASLLDRLDNNINVTVRDKGDGSYQIEFVPITKGLHRLEISLRGYPIQGSPFEFKVGTSFTYETLGNQQLSFGSIGNGKGEFKLPMGIALNTTENRVYVSDTNNHRIQVFDNRGKFLFDFGEEGYGKGKLRFPRSIVLSEDDKIYVADNGNNRIQIFKTDGEYHDVIGNHGRGKGCMLGPVGVAIVGEYLIVVEEGNHRVQVLYRHTGEHVRFIGEQGSSASQFLHPHQVAVNSKNNLIITDSVNDRVQVFTLTGEHLLTFGKPGEQRHELNGPEGVCVDDEDNILITDYHNNQIKIFDHDGNIVHTIGPSVRDYSTFKNPSSITTSMEGVVFMTESGNNAVRILC